MSAELDEDEPQIGNAVPSRARVRTVGRPRVVEDIRVIAQQYSAEVMEAMADIALDPNEKAQSRVAAGQLVLGYAHGRPTQTLEHTGVDGGPIEQKLDMSRLTQDELRTMFELTKKARGEAVS
jgi:hypothetical protein